MKTIKDEIDEIQEWIYEKSNVENFFLRYIEEGNVEAIELCIYQHQMNITVQLWNSENEEREWIEEINDYEPFYTFLSRKITECLDSFTELKSLLQNENYTN
jgi:hypothetical protein